MEGEGRRSLRRGMLPLLGLHVVNEYYRLERKPPVTAGLLLANTLIYLRPGFLHDILPTLNQVWFNPNLIVKNRDLKRFILSAFYHLNDSHLVYNMLSLLWKGIQLETSMGSMEFAAMIAKLVVMSQGMTLLLAKSLVLFLDYDRAYYYEHAVGFSGVLFAMKVVLNSQSNDYQYVHGLIVHSRHAAWAELILIQLFVPGVSFLGHLGGILAGLLYVHLRRSYTGLDPVTTVIGNILGLLSWPLKFVRSLFQWRPRRISGRGTVGGNPADSNFQGVWRCPACTFDNPVLSSVCEMCGTESEGNAFSSIRPSPSIRLSPPQDFSLEELRRRRLQRFAR